MRDNTSKKVRAFNFFRRNPKTQAGLNDALQLESGDTGEVAKPDKRFISGNRVVCACSLQFPKVDCFSPIQTFHEGYLIFNLRGGSFYTRDQFSEHTVNQVFKPGELGLVKRFTLYPEDESSISIGDIHARFLHFVGPATRRGMVLRFAKLSDAQIETFNKLTQELEPCGENEQDSIDWMIRRKSAKAG